MSMRIGVIGAGIMGSGISEVCARAGHEVTVVDVSEDALARGRDRIERSTARAAKSGRLDEVAREEALGRIHTTTELDALADRELVVEAASEDKATKLGLFSRLAELVTDERAILASNTSSIPIVELASATGDRAPYVIGIHFFNPAPVMALVELVPCLLTSEETLARAKELAEGSLGKTAIQAPDRAGFTVNALLVPYLLAAIRMLEQSTAAAKDIDTGMKLGCGHPMGPLELADLIGLDTVLGVAETLYREHREAVYAPPPLLSRLVSAGLLGRKTGRGLLAYPDPA